MIQVAKQWHGGKGSKTRNPDQKKFSDGWELAFGKKKPEVKARKKTPDHGVSQVHKDKTKPSRASYKDELRKQSDLNWDGNYE
jgi:hypothetical protein|tara:strand:+ start:220 stop:468 length:249 start_codon:yes stop_codon:yes gene_type:complete